MSHIVKSLPLLRRGVCRSRWAVVVVVHMPQCHLSTECLMLAQIRTLRSLALLLMMMLLLRLLLLLLLLCCCRGSVGGIGIPLWSCPRARCSAACFADKVRNDVLPMCWWLILFFFSSFFILRLFRFPIFHSASLLPPTSTIFFFFFLSQHRSALLPAYSVCILHFCIYFSLLLL